MCRTLVLVCDRCDAASLGEYWCPAHARLRGCYFHFLEHFGWSELDAQLKKLKSLLEQELGTRAKKRRDTLRKKISQVGRLETI